VVTLLTNRIYHGRNPEPIAQLRFAAHAAVIVDKRVNRSGDLRVSIIINFKCLIDLK
jgi:hypothetical protein